jgi:periplasmic protein TonB
MRRSRVAHVHFAPSSSELIHRPLPALSLPAAREDRRAGAVLSVALHVLLILLLVTPFAVHDAIVERAQGAGGPGPAGGGGGGRGGTGGVVEPPRERVQFVALQAPVAAPVPQVKPEVVPPKPVVPPPIPPSQPAVPEAKVAVTPPATPALPEVAATPGTGGGSGRDGTTGNGPGAGGGVGSGVGTGRGSGVGPGTGGGMQENFPPTPTELFIPPLPMPDKVRGFHLVAEYDIDETGRIVAFEFTRTRDGDYNKRLQEVLRSFRFRPGTRPDGTPIRMKAQIVYDF